MGIRIDSADRLKGARPATIADLSDTKWDTILKPSKPKRPIDNATIIGFDTEFTSDGRLLSIQFATLKSGKPVSNVRYVSSIDKEGLFKQVREFCQDFGIELTDYVVLVAHFAAAEISHINNFLSDFHLQTYNRALEGSTEIEYFDPSGRENLFVGGDTRIGKARLRIVDLSGFYPMSLEKVGEMYGLGKISLEGIGGKQEDYWKAHMDKVLSQFPSQFEEYARRDSEIAVLAYTRMREFYQANHGLDVLHYKTTPGLAMAIFRTHYLTEPVAPFELHPEGYHYRNRKTGEWKFGHRNRAFLQDAWRKPRYYSMLTYWGGRNEAYGRGILKTPIELYDVDSLYPSSAALQPLPTNRTTWIEFKSLESADGLEGFACVEFEFPNNCLYPCLPVPGEMSDKLYFPSAGKSWCTLAEVREALRLGAKIISIRGVGFRPGPEERNHPVRRFALDFMKKKRETDGAAKATNKMILVSLIGKFVETQKDVELGHVLALIKRGTITPQQAPDIYRQKKGSFRKQPRDVGSGWWIEAASLILGGARAIMSQFISKGALMAVTDSVLLPAGTNIDCPVLADLRSVGSDLKLVCAADTLWSLRTRVYALWNNGKAVKSAHHAFSMQDDEFVEWAEQCVKSGDVISLTTRRTHLVSLKEAVQKGKQLGTPEIRETKPKMDWDNKRLETIKTNPFGQWTFFPPQPRVPEVMSGRGRPRKQNN